MDENNMDKYCLEIVDSNINMSVPWYLMASYAYYKQDDPILSDQIFDKLGQKMLKAWSDIEHHHKELITEEDLRAGTYLGEYPKRVKGAVDQLRGTCIGKKSK
jgi:hypothetical protein